MAIDYTTATGQVRLLIPDTTEVALVFADEQVEAFLALEAGNARLAAAQALDTIASNEVMISKVIRTQDLQTDGAKVAAELRQRAASLREQAGAAADAFVFDVIDFDPHCWGSRRYERAEPEL